MSSALFSEALIINRPGADEGVQEIRELRTSKLEAANSDKWRVRRTSAQL